MFAYDKTFNPNIVQGHCDLISWFSDFAIYTCISILSWYIFSFFFQIMIEYDQTLDPKVLIGHCGTTILPYTGC